MDQEWRADAVRAGEFEFGVGATLLAAAVIFAAATAGALALGHEQIELNVLSVILYRFINQPGLTEIHVGPAVFLLALLAGAGRMLLLRAAR